MKPLCSIEGCDDPAVARGWCNTHYGRWKRHRDPLKTLAKPKRPAATGKPTCSIDGCDKPKDTRGWCRLHYGRWQRHGDPLSEPDYSRKPKEKLPDDLPPHLAGWLAERRKRQERAGGAGITITQREPVSGIRGREKGHRRPENDTREARTA